MKIMELMFDAIYLPSEDVVSRVIEDEMIIVPLTAGIGDMDEELYSVNETGRLIWSRLDGHKSLRCIAEELADEYDAMPGVIETDVLGLMGELARRKMVVLQ